MEDTRSRARERSPNYPSIGLSAAIELARKLWQAEKRTAVPLDVAATAVGYNSVSGASRAAIAALRQYGLIQGGNEALAVSDLAVDILVHEPGSPEWNEAIRNAADSPGLFRELRETHRDASDGALKAYLISKRRFSADGAEKLIRALRETNELVNRAGQGYDKASGTFDRASGADMSGPQPVQAAQPVSGQQVTLMAFPLGGGIRAEIRFIGGDVQPAHIQKLEAYLKVARDVDDE